MAKRPKRSKAENWIFENDYDGDVIIVDRIGDNKIKHDGFILQESKLKKIWEGGQAKTVKATDKSFISCDEVKIHPSKTTVVGRRCSVTYCECEKKSCNEEDFCGRTTPYNFVIVDRIIPSAKTSKVETIRKNEFEFDKYNTNDDALDDFLKTKQI